MSTDTSVLSGFTILPTSSQKWFWIQDHKKVIGDVDAHYEIVLLSPDTISVDVHFEGATPTIRNRFYVEIGTALPAKLEWIPWQNAKSIRYATKFNLNSPTIVTELRDALLDTENLIGNTIRKIKEKPHIMTYKEIEIEHAPSFPTHGQFQKDFIRDLEIPTGVKRVNVEYNGKSYQDLTLGQEGAGYGRIYFPNKGIEFTKNNPTLAGGEKIKIRVGWEVLPIVSPGSTKETKHTLNTILYGPPGTGKTYHTINKAIEIVNPDYDFNGKTRKQVRDEYDRLVKDQKIEFCTFHQSMSYEDFIEGIKPLEPIEGDTYLKYKVMPGIFKRLVEKASYVPDIQTKIFSITADQFAKAQFYKMSLGGSLDPEDDVIFEYCMDDNYIALGWGDDIDFTGKSESEIKNVFSVNDDKFAARAVNTFIHSIRKGDYVVISNGNSYLRAIGKVVGEYEYISDSPIRYHQFRKVDWILKIKETPVSEFYNRAFTQQSIYQLDKTQIKREFLVKAETKSTPVPSLPENYVLIIDEINRGNVSSIFGELITLIEEDKRKGNKEGLEILLPYSKKPFSVPNNLYIIGTMNTADRSVEALDTALRRRFSFEEMPPNSALLIKDDGTDKMVSAISLRKLLEVINARIAYLLDDDHRIGHSYFYDIDDDDINALKLVFKNKIIPLLREYFFNDYQKIELILGDKFITYKETPPKFASSKHDDMGKVTYKFTDINEGFDIITALKSTLGE